MTKRRDADEGARKLANAESELAGWHRNGAKHHTEMAERLVASLKTELAEHRQEDIDQS